MFLFPFIETWLSVIESYRFCLKSGLEISAGPAPEHALFNKETTENEKEEKKKRLKEMTTTITLKAETGMALLYSEYRFQIISV